MKHHKWTKPKLRLIWSSERLDEIFWADPKESRDTNKIKGRIKVKDMKEVKTGLHKSKITEGNLYSCTHLTYIHIYIYIYTIFSE